LTLLLIFVTFTSASRTATDGFCRTVVKKGKVMITVYDVKMRFRAKASPLKEEEFDKLIELFKEEFDGTPGHVDLDFGRVRLSWTVPL